MNKPAEEALKRIGHIFDEAIARERAKRPGLAPPWEGEDEDAQRYRAEEDRKAADDREWVARRAERSGEYFE